MKAQLKILTTNSEIKSYSFMITGWKNGSVLSKVNSQLCEMNLQLWDESYIF